MALENRIRRLAFEQQRAQKLTDIATEKASKLLDARDRHVKAIEERLKMHEMRKADAENARIRNLAKRSTSFQAKEENFKAIVLAN